MTRTRKALVTSAFAYVQFTATIVVGLLLVPIVLHALGARSYGLWLASGELLAYIALLDLGVFGILPWLIAEASGRDDRAAMRRFMAHGFVVGAVVGVAHVAVAAIGWQLFGDRLTAADREALGGPLLTLVVVMAFSYPLNIFAAVLSGLQDVVFNGVLSTIRLVLNAIITVVLLFNGAGLYALAIAASVPTLLMLIASVVRLATIAPDLFAGWPRPTIRELSALFSDSIGAWFGAFGWKLMAASNNVVIAYLGHPEWVPVYACTLRLSQLLTNVAWAPPDSTLVALAQIQGEGRRVRVGEVVTGILRLHLILTGGVTAVVLLLNPAFVPWWVGGSFFGGILLNAVIAAGLPLGSFIHGLATVTSALGQRLAIGIVAIVGGVLQLVLSLILGQHYGMVGIAVASIVASSFTMLPVGFRLLKPACEVETGWLIRTVIVPWAKRSWPLFVVSLIAGIALRTSFWSAAVTTTVLATAYVWSMRPFYVQLPLDDRLRRLLVTFRLVPQGI